MDHLNGYLGQPDATVVAVCDVDLNQTGKAVKRVEEKTGKKPAVYQDIARRSKTRTLTPCPCPAHSLARARLDLGDAGRQGRVRREAGQP
jgi:hypothetical protein